jgi:hypothetical protein
MFFISIRATRATGGSASSRFKVRLIAAGARHDVEKRDWRYLDGVGTTLSSCSRSLQLESCRVIRVWKYKWVR